MFPHNFFDASHITQQTEVTTTYNVKNVAAKVETLAMGLLLWDHEICTVQQSGLSLILVLIKTCCVFKPFRLLIIALRLILREPAKKHFIG